MHGPVMITLMIQFKYQVFQMKTMNYKSIDWQIEQKKTLSF